MIKAEKSNKTSGVLALLSKLEVGDSLTMEQIIKNTQASRDIVHKVVRFNSTQLDTAKLKKAGTIIMRIADGPIATKTGNNVAMCGSSLSSHPEFHSKKPARPLRGTSKSSTISTNNGIS